ncbi:MAG TPA: rhomboid family intramembrane serine protease [Verrucomicrobiae bacterium]|jgi:membrane associated rhomboid family serine protease
MLQPPPINRALLYPVTTSVAVAATVVTGYWWTGHSIDSFDMNGEVWANWQLWRALTCILPHGNFFHLAFNLYWLWVFGTLVEHVYGHLKCAAIFLLLAFGSSLGEYAVFDGGIGLSGVGYGLWGMIWVLEQRDARFHGAVDYQTSQTFVIWFFLCIGLTMANIMPVANVAHGVGAILGVLLGFSISGDSSQKWKSILGLAALMGLLVLGATWFWPWVNISKYAEPKIEWAGYQALQQGDPAGAVKFLTLAVKMPHAPARAWYNLGVAYERSGQPAAALAAFEQAARMPEADAGMQQAVQDMKDLYQKSPAK